MSDAAQRVRARIKEWTERQGHGSKKRLADAVARRWEDPARKGLKNGQAWATGIINGRQDLRLADLDAVADLLGEPPGALVRKNDRNYHELTMAETRLVMHYRSLPEMVRHNWLAYLDYLFRFHEQAIHDQGRERQTRTVTQRRREAKTARRTAVGERL